MGKVKLTIGDWSKDGHGLSEFFVYEVNKSVSEIRQGYKDSCKKLGLQFNENKNYSGLAEHFDYGTNLHICTEYERDLLSVEAKDILFNNGIDINEYFDECVELEGFAELIMAFIKISVPDLIWEEGSFKRSELKTIEPINGWWNDELNVTFGYGLF